MLDTSTATSSKRDVRRSEDLAWHAMRCDGERCHHLAFRIALAPDDPDVVIVEVKCSRGAVTQRTIRVR